jgi:hypothetical protein
MLCASLANTLVSFRGLAVPVCGIHERMFRRWGDNAEPNAETLWSWGPWSAAAALAAAANVADPV